MSNLSSVDLADTRQVGPSTRYQGRSGDPVKLQSWRHTDLDTDPAAIIGQRDQPECCTIERRSPHEILFPFRHR